MKIHGGTLYKIVEFNQGILILNALDSMMQRPEAKTLAVGTASQCGEYLMVYLHARSGSDVAAVGKGAIEAHRQARSMVPGLRKGDLDE